MSKRKKNGPEKPEIEKQTDYYKLKTKAVDDLVNADESNSPEVSEEELRAYRSGPRLKIADWVKLLFIKAWFASSSCGAWAAICPGPWTCCWSPAWPWAS